MIDRLPSLPAPGAAERRAGTRVAVRIDAIRTATSTWATLGVRLTNLSLGGARCVGLDAVDGGAFELALDVPGEPEPLRLQATPVGAPTVLGDGRTEVGLRFVGLRKRELVELAHLLW